MKNNAAEWLAEMKARGRTHLALKDLPHIGRIVEVAPRRLKNPWSHKERDVLVVEFDSGRTLGLSTTTIEQLIADFGPEFSDWKGKLVAVDAGFHPATGVPTKVIRAIDEAAPAELYADDIPF